jgi:hypothetical protein
MRRPWIILVLLALFALGLAGGAWLSIERRAARFAKGVEQRATSPAQSTASLPPPVKSAFPTEEEMLTAIMSAVAEPEPLRRAHLLRNSIGKLTAPELAALFQKATQLEDYARRGALLHTVLVRWFALVPQGAEAACRPYIVRYRAGGLMRWRAVEGAVHDAWVPAQPERALAEAVSNSNARWAQYAASSAIKAMGGGDVARQIRALAQIPPGDFRTKLSLEIVKDLAKTDPKAAEAALSLVADPRDRAAMQTEILGNLAKTDSSTACTRAATAAADLPRGNSSYKLIAEVWQQAGATAPEKALQMVEQLPEELRSRATAATLLGWAKTDPTAALEWAVAQGLDPTDMKTPYGGYSCHTMILEALSGDRAKTIAWLSTQPSSPRLDDLLRSALWQASQAEAESLLQRLTPDAMPTGAGQYVLNVLKTNPEAAVAWTSAQPAGEVRSVAIKSLVGQQVQNDIASISAFTDAWRPGPDRDAALSGASGTVAYNQPMRGVELARQIGNAEMRDAALQNVVWTWSMRDFAGAKTWIASAPELSASMRQTLFRTLERN